MLGSKVRSDQARLSRPWVFVGALLGAWAGSSGAAVAQMATQLPMPQDWDQRRRPAPTVVPSAIAPVRTLPVPSGSIPVGQGTPPGQSAGRPLPPPPATDTAAASAAANGYRVLVVPINAYQAERLKALLPQSFGVVYRGQAVVQAGLFQEAERAEMLSQQLRQQGFSAATIAPPGQRQPSFAVNPATAQQRDTQMNVLLSRNPQEQLAAFAAGRRYATSPVTTAVAPTLNVAGPPRPGTYRVLVRMPLPQQSELIRTLVPTAFTTAHRGQAVMQVGLFGDPARAEAMANQLRQRGLDVMVETPLNPGAAFTP